MDKEKALKIAEKLLELASHQNTSSGEVDAAIRGLQRVLTSHNLSMFDVKERKLREDVISAEVKTDAWRVHQWVKVLASNMALAFSCKVLFSSYPNPNAAAEPTKPLCRRYVFIGSKTEAQIASFFFDVFLMRLPEMAEKEGREKGYAGKELLNYINGFIIAASRVLKNRLVDYNEDQEMARLGKAIPKIVQDAFPEDSNASFGDSDDDEDGSDDEESEDEDSEDAETPAPAPKPVSKEEYALMLRLKSEALDRYLQEHCTDAEGMKQSQREREEREQKAREQSSAQEGLQDGPQAGHSMAIHQGLTPGSATPETKPEPEKRAGRLLPQYFG